MFIVRMPSSATPRSTSTAVTRSGSATGAGTGGAGGVTGRTGGGSSPVGSTSTDMATPRGRIPLLRRPVGDLDAAEADIGPVRRVVERGDAHAARGEGRVGRRHRRRLQVVEVDLDRAG